MKDCNQSREVPHASSVRRPRDFLTWALRIFGPLAADRRERAMRFTEEALELAQSAGLERGAIDKILDRVFSRPPGDLPREIGQSAATLELLAESQGLSTEQEAQREWERVRAIPKHVWDHRHGAKIALGISAK